MNLEELKQDLADYEEVLRQDEDALVAAHENVTNSLKRRNEAARALADYQKTL